MFKKIVLVLATFGLASVGYLAYVWQDNSPSFVRPKNEPIDLSRLRPANPVASQAAEVEGSIKVTAGKATIMRIIDPKTGEPTIVFQAQQWNPISANAFHLEQPTARVQLPGGQLAYVRADEGEIIVQRDEKNNYNPKSGNLKGHVQLVIDRTTPQWRKQNLDQAEPEQHPEAIVKIWMDDVEFDLNLAHLHTKGPVVVQSVDGTLEGRGLTLMWNEVNRRIKLLRIDEGKSATIHTNSLVQLGIAKNEPTEGSFAAEASADRSSADISSTDNEKKSAQSKGSSKTNHASGTNASHDSAKKHGGNRAHSTPAPAPTRETHETRETEKQTITLADLEDRETLAPDRVDTYQIVFKNNIVAEQNQGIRVVGSLKADELTILRDFGSSERAAVEHAHSDADDKTQKPHKIRSDSPEAAQTKAQANGIVDSGGLAKKNSTLKLQWSGTLEVMPEVMPEAVTSKAVTSEAVVSETQKAEPSTKAGERFHITAIGNPVKIHDQESGDVECQKLEYHEETQQITLTGTADDYVTLHADSHRQIAGEKITLNRQEGWAKVEGPGQMIDRRGSKTNDDVADECIREELKKSRRTTTASALFRSKDKSKDKTKAPDDEEQEVLVTWKDGIDILFGVTTAEMANPTGKPSSTGGPNLMGGSAISQRREYLKSAQFRGDVSFSQPGQTMAADTIDIVFSPPTATSNTSQPATTSSTISSAPSPAMSPTMPPTTSPAEPAGTSLVAAQGRNGVGNDGVAAQAIHAQGHVRMTNDQSDIRCDRLDIEMTTNDIGENVPASAHAYGHVVARQGEQEIQSNDGMNVTLASIPKNINTAERERYEAAAKTCGYTTDSPEWKKVEAKLASKRTTILRTLVAHRDVTVKNPSQNVDVAADSLECNFDDNQQINWALVMGTPTNPAHISMTDFYIRGPQILFDTATQSASVPGEGILRFYTKQELTGQPTENAVPVVVSWKNDMKFDGQQNIGVFSGSVRAVSQNTVLDGRELRLQFENLPKESVESQPASGPDPRWIAGPIIDKIKDRHEQPKNNTSAMSVSRDLRKRLANLRVSGDGVILSKEYEKPKSPVGPFSSLMASIMPDALQTPASQPAQEDLRLMSSVRISGPQIAIDLIKEYLTVEGAGNLLIEDYRLPKSGKGSQETGANSGRPTGGLSSGMASSLQSDGPSQTFFTWQNSMSYLNHQNIAVLDNNVTMKHAAGSQMVMLEQAAAAMKIDPRQLMAVRGRRAELTCGKLIVEFLRNSNVQHHGQGSALSSATELRAMTASQRVLMKENNRSVEGDQITYDSNTGMVKIQGTPQMPAYSSMVDEKTGASLVPDVHGQFLEWNLKTGEVKTDFGGTAVGR